MVRKGSTVRVRQRAFADCRGFRTTRLFGSDDRGTPENTVPLGGVTRPPRGADAPTRSSTRSSPVRVHRARAASAAVAESSAHEALVVATNTAARECGHG